MENETENAMKVRRRTEITKVESTEAESKGSESEPPQSRISVIENITKLLHSSTRLRKNMDS